MCAHCPNSLLLHYILYCSVNYILKGYLDIEIVHNACCSLADSH